MHRWSREVLQDQHKIVLFQQKRTRSNEAISISLRVTTRNGTSMGFTRPFIVGCSRTLVLNDNPSRASYIELLICCMGKTRPSRVQHVAVRTTLSARAELVASITSDPMPLGVGADSYMACITFCLFNPPFNEEIGPLTLRLSTLHISALSHL